MQTISSTSTQAVFFQYLERGKILPIHYALGSAALTAKAKRTIDRYVLKVLEDDLNAIVEIGSYTDAQGSDQFNLTLSENRA